jgi:hypothetical protein
LVTNVLFLTVPLHQLRVRFPALSLVIGVFVPPLLLAIAHHLAILDIRRQLPAARMRAALALAIRPTANSLLGTVPRSQKRALAVKTTAGLVHVDSSGFEQKSLRRIENQKWLCDQRRKPTGLGRRPNAAKNVKFRIKKTVFCGALACQLHITDDCTFHLECYV